MSGVRWRGAWQRTGRDVGRSRGPRRAARPAGPPISTAERGSTARAAQGSAVVDPAPTALDVVRGRLVVSCAAAETEPLCGPEFVTAMARSVLAGGAAALWLEGPGAIAAVRAETDAPIIGVGTVGTTGVRITPTADAVRAVIAAGADLVALDATNPPFLDGSGLDALVRIAHDAGVLVVADVATVEQGLAAEAVGADAVSTTLSGHVEPGAALEDPDLELVSRLAASLRVPVVAGGRLHTPDDAAEALRRGAHAVVVGGAITQPTQITRRFVAGLAE